MHGECRIIFRLLLHQLKIVIPKRSLRTCRRFPSVLTVGLKNVFRWPTDTAIIKCVIRWFLQTILMIIILVQKLLLSTSSRILAIGIAKHGLNCDLTAMRTHRFRCCVVRAMDCNRLKLEILTRRPVENLGRLGRSFHLWRWCQDVFSGALAIRR